MIVLSLAYKLAQQELTGNRFYFNIRYAIEKMFSYSD